MLERVLLRPGGTSCQYHISKEQGTRRQLSEGIRENSEKS